jgi:transglutaminase-like putative cysteine protease
MGVRLSGGELARPKPRTDDGKPPPFERTVAYTVTLEPHWRQWLFALDMPASLPRHVAEEAGIEEGGVPLAVLTRDQTLVASQPVTQPLRYRQTSLLRNSYPVLSSELEGAGVARYLQLASENPRTIAFARALRDAHPDDVDFIRAVLAYFRNEPFVYTLSPGEVFDRNPVDGFMFELRRGFCEHYASAFVVMLRAAGIPARVVTGYQGGEINPRGGYMIVRQSDAHAWAEAIIDGRWQRFDPTAAVAPSRVERGLFGSVAATEPVPFFARDDSGFLKDVQLALDAFNHQWRRNVIQFNRDRQRALWREWKLDRFEPWQVAVGASIALLVWAGGVFAWFAARRKRQERALTLWNDVCRRLARAGLPRMNYEGPIAFAGRAASRWPQFAIAFRAIGESFAALRYGVERRDSDRLALIATLERAIDVLPAPRSLRAM